MSRSELPAMNFEPSCENVHVLILSEFVAACQIMSGEELCDNAVNGLNAKANRHNPAELLSGPSLHPFVTIRRKPLQQTVSTTCIRLSAALKIGSVRGNAEGKLLKNSPRITRMMRRRSQAELDSSVAWPLASRMKSRVFTALFGLLMLSINCEAEVVSIQGQKFLAAFTNQAAAGSIIEYLPKGQTLDHWTNLFAVRLMPKETSPEDYIVRMAKDYANGHRNMKFAIGHVESSDRWWVDFITYDREKNTIWALLSRKSKEKFLEWNFFRAENDASNGMILYQYAERHYYTHATDDGLNFKSVRQAMVPFLKTNDFSISR